MLKQFVVKVYSSGQYSIASQHYDPDLSTTVSVTVPEISYHLQVLTATTNPCKLVNKNSQGLWRSSHSDDPGQRGSSPLLRISTGGSREDLDSSSYLLPRVRFKRIKSPTKRVYLILFSSAEICGQILTSYVRADRCNVKIILCSFYLFFFA